MAAVGKASESVTAPGLREEYLLRSVEALRQHYRPPTEGVVLKTIDVLDDYCRRIIAAAPFLVFATGSSRGLDCSPKGDKPGFVQVLDEKTLLLPDRPGNNRIDGLTNLVEDPRVGMIFLIPGMDDALRVNGRAGISVDPELLQRCRDAKGKLPRSVIAVRVEEVFLHCGRAIEFAGLWSGQTPVLPEDLPDPNDVYLAHIERSKAAGKKGSQAS